MATPAGKKPRAHSPKYDTARLEALFASIGEGVIVTNEAGEITRINKVALCKLGYRKSDVIDKRLTEKIIAVHENGSVVDIIDRPIAKAFMLGETVTARTTYCKKDGSLLPVTLTISPIIFRKRPIGAIEVFRDLTSEIESDKLKSDFISIASHQLRTPLSAINMYTRMLQDGLAGKLTDEQHAFTSVVLASVKRMNELIDTLLNITRIEAGGLKIRPKALDVGTVLETILTEFFPSATEKHIALTGNIPDKLPIITTDSLLFREICANFISNAIKYTPAGGKVHVALAVNKQRLLLSVKDNGYGIPTDAQKHIFTKFYRAENITIQDVSGTGLGLYLTKTVADNLGGEVWFKSKENVGTTFYFSLPLHPITTAAPTATS